MTEKKCSECGRRFNDDRKRCDCGVDLLLFPPLMFGDIGFDTNLEPTIGLGGGVSMDLTDGDLNFMGIDGGHLESAGGAVADAAGAVADAVGDAIGGAFD